MSVVFTLAAGASTVAWIWLAALHGRFWDSQPELPLAWQSLSPSPLHIAAVIPARNEEDHIVTTMHSLLRQHLPGRLTVVVVDDNSTDGTGELVRACASQDSRFHLVSGATLPARWTGKMWAVHQGLQHPAAQQADAVLLTDADITHGPGHLLQMLTALESQELDMLSEMVRLRAESLPERAFIPAFIFFFGMLYPFHQVNDPHRKTAAAAGGSILLRRSALDRIDGVQRIRAELIDDCALAREVKRGGHRIWLGHATLATSARTYPAIADVWNMIARTAYVQLQYSPGLLLGTVAGMLLLYAVPVGAALSGGTGKAHALGLAAWFLQAMLFQLTLKRYRRSPAWGIALPAIGMFYMAATVASAVRFYRGQGGQWKGRSYGSGGRAVGATR